MDEFAVGDEVTITNSPPGCLDGRIVAVHSQATAFTVLITEEDGTHWTALVTADQLTKCQA